MKAIKRRRIGKRALSVLVACAVFFSNVELMTFAAETDAGAEYTESGIEQPDGTETDISAGDAEAGAEENTEQPDGTETDVPAGENGSEEEIGQPGGTETDVPAGENGSEEEIGQPGGTETDVPAGENGSEEDTEQPDDTEPSDVQDGTGAGDEEPELPDSVSDNELPAENMQPQTSAKSAASSVNILSSGKVNNISWSIDDNYHLIAEGTGDYVDQGKPPWAGKTIYTAEIRITGITSTRNMFYNCRALKSVDLTGLDTSQVTDMKGMFAVSDTLKYGENSHWSDSHLVSLDLSHLDTSHVTNMENMFRGCDKLTSLNLSGFDTSNVTNMGSMFEYCCNLRTLDLSSFNTSNVTNMRNMFRATADYLNRIGGDTTIDLKLGENFRTGKVTDMSGMFDECWYLQKLDVSGFDTSKVTNMTNMFSDCYWLSGLDVSGFDTSKVTSMESMFAGCRSVGVLDVSNFRTDRTNNMNCMFLGCSSLKNLSLGSFYTVNAVDLSEMFSGCRNLQELDLSSFDTSSVENMSKMFSGCGRLQELNLSSFDTSGVENMSEMFSGCSRLQELNLSSFDTSHVKDMHGMFTDCSALTNLDLSGFDLRSVSSGAISYAYMEGCNGLTRLCTPKNCGADIKLPTGADGTAQWYGKDGREYTVLPTGLSYNLVLYKNSYPGAGEADGKVFISGVTVKNKVYDGEAYSYSGEAAALDQLGRPIEGAVITVSYSGTLADGKPYEESAQAPSQAGNYVLALDVKGADGRQYDRVTYPFRISRRTVSVTAQTVSVELGGTIPKTSELQYTVDGLVGEDKLAAEPTLRYSVEPDRIPTDRAGSYAIIPEGAAMAEEAAVNYVLKYIEGKLRIGLGPEDEEAVASGKVGGIIWQIDGNGKLTIKGKGEYRSEWAIGRVTLPWTKPAVRDLVVSAVVEVSDISNLESMFAGCSNLRSVDLSGLKIKKKEENNGTQMDVMTMMNYMFADCDNLQSVDLSTLDMGNVYSMSNMFAGCGSLESVDLGSGEMKYLSDIYSMFYYCSNLKSMDLSGITADGIGHAGQMFAGCSSLQSVDLSGLDGMWGDLSYMFADCSALASLDLSSIHTGAVDDMTSMFYNCRSLKELDLSSFGYHPDDMYYPLPRHMQRMFQNCSSLERLTLDDFDTSYVENMDSMFAGCSALRNLDLNSFNMSRVSDMDHMFANCSSLESIDLSNFHMDEVAEGTDVSADGMFSGCRNLTRLGLNGFDTSRIGMMRNMFYGCSNLQDIDLSGFDTSRVTKMSGMFYGCSSLTGLDLRSFDMGSVAGADGNNMFGNCSALSYLFTPKNCKTAVSLPISAETDQWTSQDGTLYTELPKGQAESILIYKNGYLDDPSGGLKQIVSVSGISIEDKVYDGKPVSYTGTATLTDTEGTVLSGVETAYSYAGLLADGTVYAETAQAPSQAGEYSLTVNAAGEAAGQYVVRGNKYSFRIQQRELSITADAVTMKPGDRLPEVADLKYTVKELLENDQLIKEPSFRYDPEPDAVPAQGSYQIIPYGAEAGNNYCIRYIEGILMVGDMGDVLPDDIPADGKIPDGLWIAGVSADGYDYTGKAVKPDVRVYDHKTLLCLKIDYTIAYARNTKAYIYASGDQAFEAKKAPTITVTGKGNYAGKETQYFRILPLDISGSMRNNREESGDNVFTADGMAVAYNRKAQKPLPVLMWNDRKLKNKTDYTIAYYEDKSGEKIDSVKETGQYWIELTGKGNFTGRRRVALTVTDQLRLMSKTTVTKIPNQPYTGSTIMPALTVKDGGKTLTEGIHYKVEPVEAGRNTAVGTGYMVITGLSSGTEGYSGTKRVSFKITGTPMSKVTVNGLKEKTFIYEGTDQEPELKLTAKVKTNGIEEEKTLTPKIDYTTKWQKNKNAGTATVIFTGRGGYTGTLKKTFKIKKFDISVNADGRFAATLTQTSVPYAKGGAKPAVTVTFRAADGSVQTLAEGQDYTLVYRKNTAVNDGSDQNKRPAVIVKGKGNYSGTYGTELNYQITPQDIGRLMLTAADKTYQNKKNKYATKVAVTDLNGKALKAGTDYSRTFVYRYKNETAVKNEMASGGIAVRVAGEAVDQNDVIPAKTVLQVTVTAREGGNYTGTITGEYRIAQAAISSAAVSVSKQIYTGREITPDKSQFTVKIKGKPVAEDQWEIVPGSYKNNVKKGTASVTICGVDNYGGTKTVKFTIKAKGFLWWWRKQE